MTKQEIINLFPLKGTVTQDIIDNANVQDIYKCIGAMTLKAALPEELHDNVTWCTREGFIYPGGVAGCNIERLYIITNIDMMTITKPREVLFEFECVDNEIF